MCAGQNSILALTPIHSMTDEESCNLSSNVQRAPERLGARLIKGKAGKVVGLKEWK